MKVTAIIPDDLVDDVKQYSGGKNVTESLMIALREWVELKRITELNQMVADKPLEFSAGYSARKVRQLNRK